MKKRTGVFIISFVMLLGCFPAPKKRVIITPEKKPLSAPLLQPDLIERKLNYLSEILQNEGISEEDKEMASALIETYKSLRESSSRHLTESEYRNIIHKLSMMLATLDDKYFSGERGVPGYSAALSLFADKRNRIMDSYFSGDFKGVIRQCLDLKSAFGPDAMTPEIGLVFALSLGKQGLLEDAVNVGEGIARDIETNPDIILLRAKIAEWQLALGQRKKALHTFDKLTDNLDEKSALLKGLEKTIEGGTKRYGKTEDIEEGQPAERETETQDLSNLDTLLRKVDMLVQRHAYDEARLLLIRHRIRQEDGPDVEIIDEALKGIETAEEQYQKERLSPETHRKETLATARRLMEEENYEEALDKLEELKDAQQAGSEYEALKKKVIEKLINHERNRAAKLFLAAKEMQDTTKKKEYLAKSYSILLSLIQKYPSSPLHKKLQSHISKVREALDKLGMQPKS